MGIGDTVEAVTEATLRAFLERLGKQYEGAATFYLLGGSALCLLGNPRVTVDVDYWYAIDADEKERFVAAVEELAEEMHLDVEDVPLDEFVPLAPGAYERCQLVGRFGGIEACIFDLYTIALSKIARGFEADLEDVVFMLRQDLVAFDELERLFKEVLPQAPQADIIPSEFKDYFAQLWQSTRKLRSEKRRKRGLG
jgi:hypothetical protein